LTFNTASVPFLGRCLLSGVSVYLGLITHYRDL
jgi:hypothetical protein